MNKNEATFVFSNDGEIKTKHSNRFAVIIVSIILVLAVAASVAVVCLVPRNANTHNIVGEWVNVETDYDSMNVVFNDDGTGYFRPSYFDQFEGTDYGFMKDYLKIEFTWSIEKAKDLGVNTKERTVLLIKIDYILNDPVLIVYDATLNSGRMVMEPYGMFDTIAGKTLKTDEYSTKLVLEKA